MSFWREGSLFFFENENDKTFVRLGAALDA
jgi:hypothetical protein